MVNNIVKRLQNIMRMDAGINGDAQRIEQMVWMFFMKVYDTQEETWEYKAYKEKQEFHSLSFQPPYTCEKSHSISGVPSTSASVTA